MKTERTKRHVPAFSNGIYARGVWEIGQIIDSLDKFCEDPNMQIFTDYLFSKAQELHDMGKGASDKERAKYLKERMIDEPRTCFCEEMGINVVRDLGRDKYIWREWVEIIDAFYGYYYWYQCSRCGKQYSDRMSPKS